MSTHGSPPGYSPPLRTPDTPSLHIDIPTERTPLRRNTNSGAPRRIRRKAPPVFFFPGIFLGGLCLIALISAWNLTWGQCRIGWLCDILRGELEPWGSVLARNTGAYAPYANGKGGPLPAGCYVDQVSILHRHTGRYPTHNAAELLRHTLAKIANRRNRVPTNRPEFAFLRAADMELLSWDFGKLTDQGRRAAYDSGRSFAKRYANLTSFIRTTDAHRVEETSRFWLEGASGADFNTTHHTLSADVIIPEGKQMNNTLSVHSCRAFNELSPAAGSREYRKIVRRLQPAADRLNGILDPQPPLDVHDIMRIASMCGFDTTAAGGTQPANWGWSRWCRMLERSEWEVAGYAADVERWYRVGDGGHYGRIMGAGWVNELLARLTDSVPIDNTTVNRTLDGDEATFPRGGKTLFVDFTHDNEMVEILTAMNMRKLRTKYPLGALPRSPKTRRFILAHLIPFGARWAVERVVCPRNAYDHRVYPTKRPKKTPIRKKSVTYVRVLINNTPTHIDHMSCRSSMYHDQHLCELEAFLESQVGSRDADWGVCGARY